MRNSFQKSKEKITKRVQDALMFVDHELGNPKGFVVEAERTLELVDCW